MDQLTDAHSVIFGMSAAWVATAIFAPGDPPNIMIGSAANLSFNDFVIHLAPCVIIIIAVQVSLTHLIWGTKFHATAQARARVMALDELSAIVDPALIRLSLIVLSAVIAAFVFARPLHLEPGTIALFGAAILMLCHNIEHHREMEQLTVKVTATFNDIDWITISFSSGCSSSCPASMSPAFWISPRSGCWRRPGKTRWRRSWPFFGARH
jgi:Na+/H+ antiporter NhaD/arsenite permease-like protein